MMRMPSPRKTPIFLAIGSALNYDEKVSVSLSADGKEKLSSNIKLEFEVARLDPLSFREAYEAFTERQNQYSVAKKTFPPMKETASSASTPVPPPQRQPSSVRTAACFLFLQQQQRKPVKDRHPRRPGIYSLMPDTARIVYSCSTGYGEALIKAGLMLDEGRWRPSPITTLLPSLIQT